MIQVQGNYFFTLIPEDRNRKCQEGTAVNVMDTVDAHRAEYDRDRTRCHYPGSDFALGKHFRHSVFKIGGNQISGDWQVFKTCAGNVLADKIHERFGIEKTAFGDSRHYDVFEEIQPQEQPDHLLGRIARRI